MLNLINAIDRFTENIIPSKELFLKSLKERKLKIYHGVDPTGPDLHLGHSTNYLLMRALQEEGHKIILLIGDFTAQIGDPSDKSSARKKISREEIADNLKTYKKQVEKILNFTGNNPAEIMFNSAWLGKLTFSDVIELGAEFTVQQMIERDMFQKRLKENKPLYVHEFLYPLAQGYDSVAMKVDAEIGGTDQTFNMMAGRTLVKSHLSKNKYVISTPLLINPKTGEKMMSKTLGNYIGINETPSSMYGKILALPDETILNCLKLCTMLSDEKIEKIQSQDIFNQKKFLAREIVRMYHGEKSAIEEETNFSNTFQKGELPNNTKEVFVKGKRHALLDLVFSSNLVESRSEAKRLISQKAVEVDGDVKTDPSQEIEIAIQGTLLKIGKSRFIKIRNK